MYRNDSRTVLTVVNLHNGLTFDLGKNDFFATARKRIIKLVQLQSLAAKYCKIRKI